MNLFKKYFEGRENQSEERLNFSPEEDDELIDENLLPKDKESLDAFLRKRLADEFEEFAKLIIEEEFDTKDLEEFIFETKKKSAKKIKIVAASVLDPPKIYTTGSPNLDKLLEGGIRSKSLVEIYGPPGSGKTQLLLQLAASGIQNGKVIFLDTEGTFSPPRINMILERFPKGRAEKLLDQILVVRITDFKEQLASVELIADKLSADEGISLVLIDSITSLFRARLWGDKLLKIRQQLLNFHFYELKKLAEEFDVAVVYSNQVTADFNGIEGSIKPVGGNVAGHNATVRILMKKGKNGYFEASIVSSSFLPPKNVRYNITSQGII